MFFVYKTHLTPQILKLNLLRACRTEVPDTISETADKTQDWFQGFTHGLTLGVGRALARTGSGIVEMATFFIPIPKDYESLAGDYK